MLKKGFLVVLFLILSFNGGTLAASLESELQIIINIPAFTLYLYENGVQIKAYPIAIGSELNPSVLGETTIINKVVDPTYYPTNGSPPILPGPDNPVGTRWLGLDLPGYGIHGTNRPESIGTAVSLGCIRMHNSAIEELAALVALNTPVKLIYQTVVLHEDPLLHTKTITVYPDVYKQGVTPWQLEEKLAKTNWAKISWPALLTLLKLPTGKPEPIPWAIDLYLEDRLLDFQGVEWGAKQYVPWDLPLDLRLDVVNYIVQWDDNYYLPLEKYLHFTGLSHEKTQGAWIFTRPTAYLEDTPLGKVLQFNGETYLTSTCPNSCLIPKAVKVVVYLGEVYYPLSMFPDLSIVSP